VLSVLGPLPFPHQLDWVSPLERHGFAEYRDKAFLERIGCADCWPKLATFWPRGGPSWDALGTLTWPDGRGVLLVEAKSHVKEIRGVGCDATPVARERITQSLAATKRWLGVSDDVDWLGFPLSERESSRSSLLSPGDRRDTHLARQHLLPR